MSLLLCRGCQLVALPMRFQGEHKQLALPSSAAELLHKGGMLRNFPSFTRLSEHCSANATFVPPCLEWGNYVHDPPGLTLTVAPRNLKLLAGGSPTCAWA